MLLGGEIAVVTRRLKFGTSPLVRVSWAVPCGGGLYASAF